MTVAVPAVCEPALANQPVAARIAVLIDQVIGSILGVPPGATVVNTSSGNKANAIASTTIPAVAGKISYLSGFEVFGSGSTTGLPVDVTVTDGTTTLHYTYTFTAGVILENTPLEVEFPFPIPTSAANIAWTVSCPASGAGGTNNTVNAHGFQF